MAEELIEEIDWNGETVAIHPSKKLKETMFPHKASLVIPRTHDNKFIFSKRAKDKHPFPDTWVCAIGGKVSLGESFLDAAFRETQEEASVSLDLENVSSVKYDEDDYKALFGIFTTKEVVDINSFKGDEREIQFFKSFSLKEISEKIENNPEEFAPTFRCALKAFVEGISGNEKG